jgi:hypothetical protein
VRLLLLVAVLSIFGFIVQENTASTAAVVIMFVRDRGRRRAGGSPHEQPIGPLLARLLLSASRGFKVVDPSQC